MNSKDVRKQLAQLEAELAAQSALDSLLVAQSMVAEAFHELSVCVDKLKKAESLKDKEACVSKAISVCSEITHKVSVGVMANAQAKLAAARSKNVN